MIEDSINPGLINPSERIAGRINRFTHHAMATVFEVFIIHEDYRYAEQAAHSAFSELDKMELELSRFIENSDISRINRHGATEPVSVSVNTLECLEACARLYEHTNKTFDITIGSLIQCWLNKDKTLRSASEEEIGAARQNTGMHLMHVNKANHTVKLDKNNMCLDLGAFGKGYAVDQMATLLNEWDIDTALIHGGKSSVLAMKAPPGEKGWHVTISSPALDGKIISHFNLRNGSLSGSGLRKGMHIIDPRMGRPVQGRRAAWAACSSAADGDALSTAFMIMRVDEIREFCLKNPEIQAIIIEEGPGEPEEIIRFGDLHHLE